MPQPLVLLHERAVCLFQFHAEPALLMGKRVTSDGFNGREVGHDWFHEETDDVLSAVVLSTNSPRKPSLTLSFLCSEHLGVPRKLLLMPEPLHQRRQGFLRRTLMESCRSVQCQRGHGS